MIELLIGSILVIFICLFSYIILGTIAFVAELMLRKRDDWF